MLRRAGCAILALASWAVLSSVVWAGDDDSAVPANAIWCQWNLDDVGALLRQLPAQPPSALVTAQRGVHGSALSLRGNHQLRVSALQPLPENQFAISAWVRPLELSGYREIYRQECAQRILFSFQHDGTILSLGLHINGYVECDAPVDPALLQDGAWHLVAATFDGRQMRVYCDGQRIHQLDRPGPLATETRIPAFIGSSSGRGEHFQGALDDLTIYRRALSDAEISQLYQRGTRLLAARLEEYEQRLAHIYSRGATFAQTMAQTRHAWQNLSGQDDPDFGSVLMARLRCDYPEECARYTSATGNSPLEYLATRRHDELVQLAGTRVEMMKEYLPLTDAQWQRLDASERQQWEQVRAIAQRFDQLRAAQTAADSPDWLDVLLEAAARTPARPTVREAVAPYRTPATPQTVDLDQDQAAQALQRDWLYQADGQPDKTRVLNEIQWTRDLAARVTAATGGKLDLAPLLVQLEQIQQRTAAATGDATADYLQLRALKRQIMFRNPALDFDSVLLVDMPLPAGSEWPHETRHRLGYMAVPGGRLLVLHGLSPHGRLQQLMPQAPLHGAFWRPDLSLDASRVLFCFKPHNEKSFHLYEINIDGSSLVQLTDGPYDDLDPIYLPDGEHVLFSTTRGHTYVRCMPPTNAFVLARCNHDGRNIYLVSRNNEPDYLPSLLDDGRVVYTRWEYTDKPLWRAQGLWTVNPDGTQVSTLWGNQSVWPDLLKDARQIPGSRRIMFTGSAHHNWFSGSVGIIDPQLGLNFPHGLTKVTADVAWPESGNGPVDPIESPDYHSSGRYDAYYSPYPLSETDFLVSAQRDGKFVLYLMDIHGNRELIYEGTHHILHALPVRPRPQPPLIPDRVTWPSHAERDKPQEGTIYSGDVYQGTEPELRGKAKYLRVLHIEPKTYTYWHKRPYLSTGPVVSAVQSEGVKQILGTVPVEPDGSVSFYAPAGKAIHFQLLDERFRALQTMRSFTGVMPGERRGCLGCHESHSRAPVYQGTTLALARAPSRIEPPPWGDETISYPRFVRPVLDKYCASCHEGDGEARAVVDFTARPGFLIFDEPYLLLTGRPTWGQPYERPEQHVPGLGIANTLIVEGYSKTDPVAYQTPSPMTHLSYKSPLIELAASGTHYDVKVDEVSLRKLIAWVDTMCPYRGREEIREIEDPVFPGVDWLSVRPRIKTAPTIIRPGPVD